ncbi:unnamed protein product [Protopolystoma xenopodis]|uniref:Uncharacterized protein n=1 Tax=Protopolystoma xenopodis TaxID=117903 RepID=A0A448XKB6_9PLAT|nr:unnamed protein product [Protopolystoma xenopodis]
MVKRLALLETHIILDPRELVAIKRICELVEITRCIVMVRVQLNKSGYVCRVPLYLTKGLAQVQIKLARILTNGLSSDQLDLLNEVHDVLAELTSDISQISPDTCSGLGRNATASNLNSQFTSKMSSIVYRPDSALVLAKMAIINMECKFVSVESEVFSTAT